MYETRVRAIWTHRNFLYSCVHFSRAPTSLLRQKLSDYLCSLLFTGDGQVCFMCIARCFKINFFKCIMIKITFPLNRTDFLLTIPEHVFNDTLLVMELILNCWLKIIFSSFLCSTKIPRGNLRSLLVNSSHRSRNMM